MSFILNLSLENFLRLTCAQGRGYTTSGRGYILLLVYTLNTLNTASNEGASSINYKGCDRKLKMYYGETFMIYLRIVVSEEINNGHV